MKRHRRLRSESDNSTTFRRLDVRFDADEYAQLLDKSSKCATTMSFVVRAAVRQYFKMKKLPQV